MADAVEKRPLWCRHVISFLVAPITMTVIIPLQIAASTNVHAPNLDSVTGIALVLVGVGLIVVGLIMFGWTVMLFHRVGRGTLGVGKLLGEPIHLVVRGPYRHVRNPMITAVVGILLGEAAATASGWLLLWAVLFWIVIATFIRVWEEPHLNERFGRSYVDYRHNVPAWIPRITPWRPSG